MFKEIVGQGTAKNYLQKAIAENRLANTLLFTGPEGVGKRKTALKLATHLLKSSVARVEANTHPDLHLLEPEGKSGLHAIESIRKAIDISHQAPFEAPVKIFIIEAAERMQPAAANALLKTLEEPVLDSYWILLSAKFQEMIPTILSRCAKVPFQPLSTQQVISILQAKGLSAELAKFSEGSVAQAIELQMHPELAEARQLLLSLLVENLSYPKLFAHLEKIESLIEQEDPMIYQRNVGHLLTALGLSLRERASSQGADEDDGLDALEEVKLAHERNIKLSTCLEVFFLKKFL